MSYGRGAQHTQSPDLSLTPEQKKLLRTALASNGPSFSNALGSSLFGKGDEAKRSGVDQLNNTLKRSRKSINSEPVSGNMSEAQVQASTGSGEVGAGKLNVSSLLDYGLEDGAFEWDNNGENLFGGLTDDFNEEDGELHDKRKNPDDDEGVEGNGGKRREGEDKSAKKPGRKPLTGEPTTKRKAQNRAAQRAFRERKERHLKDLETKVDDLEKASESVNHENGKLRAQVDRLNTELQEYRKRLSLNGTGGGRSPPSATGFSTQSRNHYSNSQNDFQFAFPKFGDLPGSNFMSNGSLAKVGAPPRAPQRASTSSIPGVVRANSSASSEAISPSKLNASYSPESNGNGIYQSPAIGTNGVESLKGLFSPSILETASHENSSDYMNLNNNSKLTHPEKQEKANAGSSVAFTASPSASSMSNHGLDSSCGTTPEPSVSSPGIRKPSEGTASVIGSAPIEGSSNLVKSPTTDVNGIDLMAQQNGGQFDPVLFGDYRDPQGSILDSNFGIDFFNDAFLSQDFSTPFNTGEVVSPSPKRDLMKEVEARRDGGNEEVAPEEKPRQFLTCDKIWDRVQESEKFQSGETDMDSLCAQLKSKARCSGNGTVIDQKDVDDILGPPPTNQIDFLKMFR